MKLESATAEADVDSAIGIRRFRRRVLLFIMPPLLLAAPPMLVLFVSGEHFQNVDSVLATIDERDCLVGYAHNEQNYAYIKFQRLISLPRQSVVALGSSRVLGFRANMFDEPFYNAGFSVLSLRDVLAFVQAVPDDKLPHTLLLGLDQWMFHPDWEESRGGQICERWTKNQSVDTDRLLTSCVEVYKDLFRGRLPLNALLRSENQTVLKVGLNSMLHQTGFRNDGSYHYGEHIHQLLSGDPKTRDLDFRDTLRRIARGNRRFEWNDRIDDQSVADVRSILQECQNRGVNVVAFLPPFADRVYQEMQDSGRYGYMDQIVPSIQDLFAEFDAELHEFPSMSRCDSEDSEAIDGFHGGEVTYLKMLRRMVISGSRLGQYVNSERLTADLLTCRDRYCVY
jgi:hypothetical protein